MNDIKSEIYLWVAETSQEHVTIEICKVWFRNGGNTAGIQLYPIADEHGNADFRSINTNRQKLFRWLGGDSVKSISKTRMLYPAILEALPAERRAKISKDQTAYLLVMLNKEVSKIITSTLLQERDMSQHIKSLRYVLDRLDAMSNSVNSLS